MGIRIVGAAQKKVNRAVEVVGNGAKDLKAWRTFSFFQKANCFIRNADDIAKVLHRQIFNLSEL